MQVTGTPAQVVPVEGQVTPPVETPAVAKSDEFVKKAQLEREMWQKQKAIKQREQEITAREAKMKDFEAREKAFEERRSKAALDPDAYLAEVGLDYDKLSQYKLNKSEPTVDLQVQQLRAELEETRRSLKEKEESQVQQTQAQQQQALDQAVKAFKNTVTEILEEKAEDYELVLAASDGGPKEVADFIYDMVDSHFNQGYAKWKSEGEDPDNPPKVLSEKDALDLLEKSYEDKMKKALSGKKLGSKYKLIEEAMAEVAKAAQTESKFVKTEHQPIKTLHNGLNTQSTVNPGRPVSMDEKLQRAAALMRKK